MQDIFSEDEIEHLLKFQQEDFPEMYRAAKDDNIILFLGAGLAKMYGCLLWDEMAKELSKVLRKNKIISYVEEDVLYRESQNDPRKVISICDSLCKDKEKRSIYVDTIKDAIKIKDEKNKSLKEIYELIFSINPKAYLTTNLDLGIKNYSFLHINPHQTIYNCTSPNAKEDIKKFEYKIFKDSNIIYLHGNDENIESSILTVEKYLEFYTDKDRFLEGLFSEIGGGFIIFIGYGLKEWDVIEKIYKIYKSNARSSKREVTGCLLSPISTREIIKFNLEQSYYKSFGIQSIPYLIDDEGYDALKRVLKNLRTALDGSRLYTYDLFKEIEEI